MSDTDVIPPTDESIRKIALETARHAGRILASMQHTQDARVLSRTDHDVKMSADLASEQAVIRALSDARPEDGILSEEGGGGIAGHRGVWIIDPLDGTVNYSHGLPHFSVTLAWLWDGEPRVGVVYDPRRDEMFTAIRGGGAWVNDTRLCCADTPSLDRAMIAVGFGKTSPESGALKDILGLMPHVQKLRITGSAALDLAYVAAGRLDGYVETEVYTWDVTAGCLMVNEAGGKAHTWVGPEPQMRSCVATCSCIAGETLSVLQKDTESCARVSIDDVVD